jgi:hypothetical protein
MEDECLETRMLTHPNGWMEPVTLDRSYWNAFDWLVRQPNLSALYFMENCEAWRGTLDFNQALEGYIYRFYNRLINFYASSGTNPEL